jgi:hypothetical protein
MATAPTFLMRFLLLLASFSLGLLVVPEKLSAAASNGPDDFPPMKLRAFGTISGKQMEIGPQSSILRVTAESVPKAQLVLAKYLSDLGVLPGVTTQPLTTARGTIAARQINGQGAVAAIRSGVNVYIFTAPDAPALQALIEQHVPPTMKIDASDAEIQVPMYVDRWDKNGFRFYYAPFVKPDERQPYDPRQDFQFAKDSQNTGLVVWNSPNNGVLADGVLDFNSRAWVYKAGKELKLPMGVNIGFGDTLGFLGTRFPQDLTPNAEQYFGGWYGAINFGIGPTIAWSADATQDLMLGQLKPLVEHLKSEDTVVNWLEPHEEMCHGVTDVLDDHGPTARDNFHRFLASKYKTPEAVAARWRQPGAFHTWDDVPFPEFATFLGLDSSAIDLKGQWMISYDAPYGADSAKTDLDDSKWASLEAPGDAIVKALPRKPAVFRRHIDIDPKWRAAHRTQWLYVFDLNDTRGDSPTSQVQVFVNGKAIPENPPRHAESHWAMLDVTSALVDGKNVITVCLPQALFDYRVYLSGTAPTIYPAMGPHLNAMWADFSDWTEWSRGQAVRRGMQMIRQVDPDRPITLMSPDAYMGSIKEDAEDYGGVFHDTGGMAGSWGDMHPIMAQSMGLASDCEPGSGAVDLDDFKRFMGRWSTEGTNGIDYFQHIGDVEWKPEVKDYFTKTQNLWHLIGKYHVPLAELAVMNSPRNLRLTGFPWNTAFVAPDLIQENKFWGLVSQLWPDYDRGGVLEQDFARGKADKFRVVLDGNTTIMDPDVVEAISQWVKRGGVFITYQQTGRHTSVEQDSWPIAKLTGYAVTGIDKLGSNGDAMPARELHVVPGRQVFHPDAPNWQYAARGGGLSLKKIDPACEDLLQWNDGSIAAGVRKLGKGLVVDLGSNSSVLPGQVLQWLKLKRVPIESSDHAIMTRYFVSNNGLYDIWALWNTKGEPVTATFTFRDGFKPASCTEVNNGANMPIDAGPNGAQLSNLAFGKWETRIFMSPRLRLNHAASDWLALQRGWWSGTADPGKPVPEYHSKFCVNLTEDWACKVVAGPITGAPPEDVSMADPKLDDSSWPRTIFGIFNIPDNTDCHHAYFRKTFTVPANWTHGLVRIFARIEGQGEFREYIDGKSYRPKAPDDDLGGALTPGSKHSIMVDYWSPDLPTGPTTAMYLSYRPDTLATQPLDSWAFAPDHLTYQTPGPLPLKTLAAGSARTIVKIDRKHAGESVFIQVGTGVDLVLINGHPLGGSSNIYSYIDVNATPWIKFGADNEIVVTFHDPITIPEAQLEFFDKSRYP